jgi:phosphatidylinositol kinase/protein kinase (PI-3  family)
MQLITKMKEIFEKERTHCYLKSYEIIVTGADSGFLEFVKDSMSIDSLKKKYPK